MIYSIMPYRDSKKNAVFLLKNPKKKTVKKCANKKRPSRDYFNVFIPDSSCKKRNVFRPYN